MGHEGPWAQAANPSHPMMPDCRRMVQDVSLGSHRKAQKRSKRRPLAQFCGPTRACMW